MGECGERCCCVDCDGDFEAQETHTFSPDDVLTEGGKLIDCVPQGLGVTRAVETVYQSLCPSGNGIANQGYKVVNGNCEQCKNRSWAQCRICCFGALHLL